MMANPSTFHSLLGAVERYFDLMFDSDVLPLFTRYNLRRRSREKSIAKLKLYCFDSFNGGLVVDRWDHFRSCAANAVRSYSQAKSSGWSCHGHPSSATPSSCRDD
jgi:hypothetical protein